MTTLQPEKPGTWTEAVLLAFPEAVLTNDAPVPGVLHVTLTLADDFEIEFRRDEFTLEDAPESYSANLMSWDTEVPEELLYESSDIDLLIEAMRDWVEHYYDDMAALAALEFVPEYWVREA